MLITFCVQPPAILLHSGGKFPSCWTNGKQIQDPIRQSQSIILYNIPKQNYTELSKHIWNLKQKNIVYSIKWKILKRAKSYSNVSKRCNLCLWEKYFIICKPNMATLNRQNELVSTCRHANRFLLKNFKFKS